MRNMEFGAPKSSLYTTQELRTDLDPCTPDAIVQITLPSTSTFARASRAVRKVLDTYPTYKTEEEFKSQCAATSSSVLFRSEKSFPRAILWRCIDKNSTIELRALDLSKDEKENRDASLILQLKFPTTIRPNCIDAADSLNHNTFTIFAITTNNDLYTFTLKSDVLCKLSSSESEVDTWFKIFRPSSLAVSYPHRLQAQNSNAVTCTLGDGRLLRLTRRQDDDGAIWDEIAHNDGQWGSSLRGLIRWQGNNTVRYDGQSLDQSTAITASQSPNGEHIFVVTLNHMLKAWNLASGKQTLSRDLLGADREPNEISQVMLNPGILHCLSVHSDLKATNDADIFYVVTFTPHSTGLFTILAVRDADSLEHGIRDLFEGERLQVPDPDDGTHWTMADYKMRGISGCDEIDFWILLRLNRRYKLYHRTFSSLGNIGREWQSGWTMVLTQSLRREPSNEIPRVTGHNVADISKVWLDFILTPGRVPETVLESALSIFVQTLTPASNLKKGSLRERISGAVGEQIRTNQADIDENSLTTLQDHVQVQWLGFWNVVAELDNIRMEPVCLSIDNTTGLLWIIFSDACSAVRQSSELELLSTNRAQDIRETHFQNIIQSIEASDKFGSQAAYNTDDLAVIINAAAKFRASFTPSLLSSCAICVHSELWQDSNFSIGDRLQTFYDRADFAAEIGDREFDELTASLNDVGGFDGLTTRAIYAITEMLPDRISHRSELLSTAFGRKVLTIGARDMIALHSRVLSDLLLLVVFLNVEFEPDATSRKTFNTYEAYVMLLERIRDCHVLEWLATHSRNTVSMVPEKSLFNEARARSSSLLEDLYASDIRPESDISNGYGVSLTTSIRDLMRWALGGNESSVTFDQVVVHIECELISSGDIQLANSFLRFLPDTAWAMYVKARLCILQNKLVEAAIYFEKAAFKLSRPTPPSSFYATASASLLDPVSAAFLASGLTNYYTHILSLFALMHAHVQVVYFAELALEHSAGISSTAQHSDILARLFHSSVALADYEASYATLCKYTDPVLRKVSTSKLVFEMLDAGHVEEFLALPFSGFKRHIEDILLDRVRKEEQGLAPTSGVPYYKILYAWRIRQGDFQGAAAALIERLDTRKHNRSRGKSLGLSADTLDEYLVGMNSLALLGGDDERWVFIERVADSGGKKRTLMRLQDVRRDYQDEIDRRDEWDRGQYPLFGAGDSDEEMSG